MSNRSPSVPHPSAQSGLTVVEMLVCVALLAILLPALSMVMISTRRGIEQVAEASTTDSEVSRILDRVVDELRLITPGSLTLPDGQDGPTIEFTVTIGWDGTEAIEGPLRSLSLVDGNLFLDGARIAGGIDDLRFAFDGRQLTIRMGVMRDGDLDIHTTTLGV